MPKMHSTCKLFVWDLHGTLEQGNEEAVIELSNMALEQLGFTKRFSMADSRDLYGLRWYQYFEYLLPDEPYEIHMKLQEISFKLSDANPDLIARYMKPSRHVFEVLEAIHTSHHQQILISNTIPSAVPLFVSALKMTKYFTPENSFAVNSHSKDGQRKKEEVIKDYLKTHHFIKVYVIGDSKTDKELAHAIKAVFYLYAHAGFDFRTEGGDHRITDLLELLKEI